MSYCRVGKDSDVYVYPSGEGIVCCRCPMIGEDLVMSSPLSMLTHLMGHLAREEKVPHAAITRLMHETGLCGTLRPMAYTRLSPAVQAALDRVDALPKQWRERAQRSSVHSSAWSANELDAVLVDLHTALREWDDQ